MINSKWPLVPIYDFAQQVKRPTVLLPEKCYRTMGVRLWGKGAYARETKFGNEIKASKMFVVRTGDLVINRIWVQKGSCGVVNDALDGCVVTQDFPAFQLDHSRVLFDWMTYIFQSQWFWEECEAKSRGTSGRERIQTEDFLSIEVPLPLLEDQRRIVAMINEVISRVREVSRLQEDAIEETKNLFTSYLNSLFSKEEMAGWDECTLGNLAEIVSGVTLGRKIDTAKITVPYLRVANVQDGWLDLSEIKQVEIRPFELEKWRLLSGDLLLTEGGDFDKLGRGTVWNGEIPNCIHQNHIFRVRVDRAKILSVFLELEIQSSYGKDYFVSKAKKTTNLASINQTQLRAFPVRFPSLEKQFEMIARAKKFQRTVDVLSKNQEQSQKIIDAVLPSFLDRAFRGELI